MAPRIPDGLPIMYVKGDDAFIADIVATVGGDIIDSWEA